jgi:hypothetical protein
MIMMIVVIVICVLLFSLRLGVGVNNAFLALSEFGELIQSLTRVGSRVFEQTKDNTITLERIVDVKELSAQQRIKHLIQFQLSTMYYESYCDLAIFFDRYQTEYWKSQRLFKKDREKRVFVPITTTDPIVCDK